MAKKNRKEVFVSVDVEATGPCPGLHSMVSLGAVACVIADNEQGFEVVGEFSVNIKEAFPRDERTWVEFWLQNKEAWAAVQENQQEPKEAMLEFKRWLNGLNSRGRPIFVGYPAGFDFTYVYWYFHNFTGSCPFGFQSCDMKSYAFATLGGRFREIAKRNMPDSWFAPGLNHSHVAIEDAREQAYTFFQMMKRSDWLRYPVEE